MTKEDFIGACVDKGWLWKQEEKKILIKLKNERIVEVDTTKGPLSKELIKHIGAQDVVQMTRIVGYYSNVHNWNKSKLGELKDRHTGDYFA